ncbi:Rad4-domain-containing protein [Pleomassaria siparia CBS 279.74]|uniref:Rad4-domain-containing protein n=1 Tax=Pleomassaria siparia CBS 279.74 TaxID=1314801 RepID=A0A6G1K1B1_9PLEO|nr:Rad4-domain-containing protein [Pleomassaria siparia CBS 279.74]
MVRPRGGLHKPSGADSIATPRRSTRRGKAVPDVFEDLLSEATPSKAAGADEDRKPLKKRKTAATTSYPSSSPTQGPNIARPPVRDPARNLTPQSHTTIIASATDREDEDSNETSFGRTRQTIEDSDESDGSDLEWEDALDVGNDTDKSEDMVEPEVADLSITIGGDRGDVALPKKQVRRRGMTSVDKKRRLEIHKMHILCLLYHVHRRNTWCNDEKVQAILQKLPSQKILDNLVPNPEFTQYQASKRFVDGIVELRRLWSSRFKVTALGMHRPRWADQDADVKPFADFDELDDPMEKQDFRRAAASMQGSQDVGTQLFCALLRGIGVDARLVCSLQCLPFVSAAQPSTPQKPTPSKNVIHVDPYKKTEASPSRPRGPAHPRPKKLTRLERLLGERSASLSAGPPPKPKKKHHNAYPVYWVEAFNPAQQKWVPADPLSTYTVNAPDKLEPPLSYPENSLVYAIAFEDDYTAKDVTRRYAKAYNAKTRKFRVESTNNGAQWWKRALKVFGRTSPLDRDQVEDAALARKEGAEGMPKNVQDFKGHPIYVLERHLKHNEVIHPMQQVGKVNVGTSMNPKIEPIYRRQNVHVVRSADKWYRMGRDVMGGEQPLKHAKPKKNARRSSIPPEMDIDDGQDEVGAALYAEFQTELYIPPPVVRGRVPRNAFGNLDLYVPSMVPPGGVHIRHKLAQKAARIIGVDSVDAVTGFSFKGRHGTAVIQGVVVAQEYGEAVEAVVDAMEYAQEEAEDSQRRAEALRMWRRFFLGLRIAQRVNAIEIEGETGPVINVQEQIEREDKEIAEKEFAGGFFPDERNDGDPMALPTRRYENIPQAGGLGGGFAVDEYDGGGGFEPEVTDMDGGFVPEESAGFGSTLLMAHQLRPRRTDDDAGGFMTEDDEDDGGGFVREPSPVVAGPSSRALDTEMANSFPHAHGPSDDLGGGFILDTAPPELAQDDPTLPTDLVVENQARENAPLDPLQEPDVIEAVSVPEVKVSAPGKGKEKEAEAEAQAPPSIPSSSPSERGSLLMEDPEDEDADPDWLVDAT